MARRRPSTRRSVAEWGIRGLAAVAAVLGGYIGATQTLAHIVRTGGVERAYALAPNNGRITALMAQKLSGADATAADRARGDRLARQALRQDPTAIAAVLTLGLNAQVRGHTTEARRLLAYAERLSRRDLQTQIWAIEDAVGRGDVAGTLRHYDIALRTSRGAPDLLFPVLGSAIADPTVRVALVKVLAAKPAWGPFFADYVADSGPDRRATAKFLTGLQRVGVPVSEGAQAAIVDALTAQGLIDVAWAYYAAVRPGVDRRQSRDPRFSAAITTPTPFDWTPINDGGVTTSIQRGGEGGIFDFVAPASVGGPLLQQKQLLPPGDYRLEGRSIGIDQPEESRPYWVLSCQGTRELGRVTIPNSAQANGTFIGRFSVPAECPLQVLTLVSRPSDRVSGVAGQIDRVRLFPVR